MYLALHRSKYFNSWLVKAIFPVVAARIGAHSFGIGVCSVRNTVSSPAGIVQYASKYMRQ